MTIVDVRVDFDRSVSSARQISSPLAGKRILCVDDDELLRRVVRRTLGCAGAICYTAANHAEAIAIAEGVPELALAILDFQMPDGDVGLLIDRLRAARPLLPLIGNSGEDRRRDFAKRGVPAFLEKPWNLESLVQTMNP